VTMGKGKELRTPERKSAFLMLESMSKDGVPERGAFTVVGELFQTHRRTMSDLWVKVNSKRADALNNHNNNDGPLPPLAMMEIYARDSNKRRGGKHKFDREELKTKMKEIPLKKRRNLRQASAQLGVPLKTVWKLTKEKQDNGKSVFRRHSSALKPTLTVQNKLDRLDYALKQINLATINTRGPMKFLDLEDVAHGDEKWFYLCEDGEKYILVEDEADPKRHTRHKGYIIKIMFINWQAKPRHVPGHGWWDGKIGIWPVGHVEEAQRASAYRPKGAPVWVNDSIDKDKYRSMLINELVPRLEEVWPGFHRAGVKVKLQQDGAKSHIDPEDEEWQEFLHEMGWEDKIELVTQPANSPDTNVNDLAFFNSLQAAYYDHAPTNSFELIEFVKKAHAEFPISKLKRIWLTYQSCLNEIINNNGGNFYKIPHMGKAKMEREGTLPRVLDVTENARALLVGGAAPIIREEDGDIVEEFEVEIEGDDIEGLLDDLGMAAECDPDCVNNIL
jgi:hypothetical protein